VIEIMLIIIRDGSPWAQIQPALLQNPNLLGECDGSRKKQGILIFMGSSMHAP